MTFRTETEYETRIADSIFNETKNLLIKNGCFDETCHQDETYRSEIIFDTSNDFSVNKISETLANKIMDSYNKVYLSKCSLLPNPLTEDGTSYEILIRI